MKNKIYLLLIVVILKTHLFSQPTICAPYVNLGDSALPASQWVGCSLLRDDFKPTIDDRILTVNLVFYIFNKNDGTGRWSTTQQSNVDNAIVMLNTIFGGIAVPHLTVAGVSHINDTRIRFVKKNCFIVNDSDAYNNYSNYDDQNPTYISDGVHDCNAINIVYATNNSGGLDGGNTPNVPGKYVFMPADTDLDGDQLIRKPDNRLSLNDLVHELGHALGLGHTIKNEWYSFAEPKMGAPSCCNAIIADDLVLERDSLPGDMWGRQGVCNPTVTPNYSNNIMNYNIICRNYLSPYQMSIMHYYLRTSMKDVLTASGYTNAITVNHYFDYTVGSNETWSSDRYMKGDVIIPAGHILNITCNVAMTRNARIIVEVGGLLNINGGRVANISGELWSGIQVAGDINAGQAYTGGGFALYQGIAYINNSGSIANAENGIKNYKTNSSFVVDWNSRGGIIIADNADFINNTRDVEFYSYPVHPSASSFTGCNFLTTGVIGKTSTGTYAVPLCHVSMWDISGVKFRSCNFKYDAGNMYANHGNGLGSYNAKYSVDKIGFNPITFENLNTGIYAANGNPLRIPSITHATFLNNVTDGVYFQNLNSVVFNDNYILAPNSSNGLYLNSCQQYNVKNNIIEQNAWPNKTSSGISTYNSATGTHQVYRNTLNNLKMGIRVIGNNSGDSNLVNGMIMNCNDFSDVANYYDVALMPHYPSHTTVMTDQGKPSQGPTKLVRNIYGAAAACNGCENQWYVNGFGVKTTNHPANSDANTRPVPQPDLSDLSVNVINSGLSLNYSTDCKYNQESSGGDGTMPIDLMTNINTYLAQLKFDDTNGDLYSEIEATAISKLHLFLTDSLLQDKDSVISFFENNPGNIDNADVLTVYAYIDKGDLETAQLKASALAEAGKSSWAALLTKLINYEQEPWTLYDLKNNVTDLEFLGDYTKLESNDGFAATQAVLKTFADQLFEDPRPEPDPEIGRMQAQPAQTNEKILTAAEARINMYPNPASDIITIIYNHSAGKTLRLELKDALGRKVYESDIRGGDRLDVPLAQLTNGVYILSAYDHKTAVYQNKVVCIK